MKTMINILTIGLLIVLTGCGTLHLSEGLEETGDIYGKNAPRNITINYDFGRRPPDKDEETSIQERQINAMERMAGKNIWNSIFPFLSKTAENSLGRSKEGRYQFFISDDPAAALQATREFWNVELPASEQRIRGSVLQVQSNSVEALRVRADVNGLKQQVEALKEERDRLAEQSGDLQNVLKDIASSAGSNQSDQTNQNDPTNLDLIDPADSIDQSNPNLTIHQIEVDSTGPRLRIRINPFLAKYGKRGMIVYRVNCDHRTNEGGESPVVGENGWITYALARSAYCDVVRWIPQHRPIEGHRDEEIDDTPWTLEWAIPKTGRQILTVREELQKYNQLAYEILR